MYWLNKKLQMNILATKCKLYCKLYLNKYLCKGITTKLCNVSFPSTPGSRLNTIRTNIQDVFLQFFNKTLSSLLCFIAGKTPWYTYREWLKICSSYYDTFIETWATIQSHSIKPISRKRNIPKHSWWWDLYPFAFQQWNIMIHRQLILSSISVCIALV